MNWLWRVLSGHKRTVAAFLLGLAAGPALPHALPAATRTVLAWDMGALLLLILAIQLFLDAGPDERMQRNAEAQQEGEWTMFATTLAAIAFSFFALTNELSNVKDLPPAQKGAHVALVAGTLILSWLVTQVLFALRYAHEFYTSSDPARPFDGGLDFPGETRPDYWDFFYFALVLGMTFQVSDVQITSRKLRRLATAHGFVGFLFNTVIIALTVNIAAGLM